MSLPTLQHFSGLLRDASTSTTLYTNTSGGAQAVSVWGWSISLAILETAASTAVRFNGALQINGVTIGQVEALTQGVGWAAIAKSDNNGGAQYLLPNNGIIAIVGSTPFTNPSAWAITGDISCLIRVGSP